MYRYYAKCTRVIDGDTIKAEVDLGFRIKVSTTIRLLGIDTPEVRTKNLSEKKRGLEAKKYLKSLLKNNNNIFELESVSVDKYGRCLGTIYINNANINKKLIKEGYAKKY